MKSVNDDELVRRSLTTIDSIIGTGIMTRDGMRSPLFICAITQILIETNDLLQKLSKTNRRLIFTDDCPDGKDITDLIKECRNVACHHTSGLHYWDGMKFTFNVLIGRNQHLVIINGQEYISSDYDDDVAIIWGQLRLYLKRHLGRVLDEVKALMGR